MAIGYIQFKSAQEMEAYLNSIVTGTTYINGKVREFKLWYTHREVAHYVDRVKLRVYESFYCPELDY
jgi:hypothetical protein